MEPTHLTSSNADFWKRKLAAFLHDSPSKPLDIAEHETVAAAGARRSGNVDNEGRPLAFDHESDWTAAAADRIPFPHWGPSGVRCAYDPFDNPFRHPFNGAELKRTDIHFTPATAEDVAQNNQPLGYDYTRFTDPTDRARAEFFAHWRLWTRHTQDRHAGFSALPADTRLPDHSIWSHIGVVSAFAGATFGGDQPALLKFQVGPVQDFIAAARSTRDLWSGSYLLSWLMATGLSALATEIGPDAVIFPNLHGQPLVDLRFRKKLWEKLNATNDAHRTVWDDFTQHEYSDATPLQTPNLPNLFLALVPASRAKDLAELVKRAITDEWLIIATHVKTFCAPLFALDDATIAQDAETRFGNQVKKHLDLSWQVTAFPQKPEALVALAEAHLPKPADSSHDPVTRVRHLLSYFTEKMPTKDRDARFYIEGDTPPKTRLNNIGIAWSLAVALNSWQLDAARSLRRFDGLSSSSGHGNNAPNHGGKDALNGRDLMLFGGNSAWLEKVRALGPQWKNLFRHTDELGALTLIKRTWHLAHLRDHWELNPHGMPNTHEIATGKSPDNYDAEQSASTPTDTDGQDNYYALLAFDGDSIGQWISGEKTPSFRTQLAAHCHRQGKLSPLAYFEKLDATLPTAERLLDLKRPLSPGYHLQFSAALGNFALHCAPAVVRAYGGHVLYAGGDDVLAMVPAAFALSCADDLQRVFRGLSPTSDCGITELAPGFLSLTKDSAGRAIPLILPGPTATASVGLAFAHFMQPLQDVVRAAHTAEKQAKKIPGKHGVTIKLFKRSGEITEWSTRFDSDTHTPKATPEHPTSHRGGLHAAQWLLCALGRNVGSLPDNKRPPTDQVLSAKFPYRLAALLEPHLAEHGLSDSLTDQLIELISRELDHAMDRQRGDDWSAPSADDTKKRLRKALLDYLTNLPGTATEKIRALLGLLATAAFLGRQPALNAK
jgi:CRISPR-associated protein Cmr2